MRDDRTLIQDCLEGDATAWDELVARYQRLVYSVPRRLGLGSNDADDVFQTVWGIVLRKLDTLRDEARLAAWLIRLTYRESYRWVKRRRAMADLPESLPSCAEAAEDDVLRWERQHLVRLALASIGDRCRRLLEALFYDRDQADYQTIADRLGLRIGSIGPTRARCLDKLARQLRERGWDTEIGPPT